MAKKESKPKSITSKKPIEIKKIVPGYLRIDSCKNWESKIIQFGLSIVSIDLMDFHSIGSFSDKWIPKEIFQLLELPPCAEQDVWNGYLWDTEESAIIAREKIRLYLMEQTGRKIENL